jgi:hypothetical protein
MAGRPELPLNRRDASLASCHDASPQVLIIGAETSVRPHGEPTPCTELNNRLETNHGHDLAITDLEVVGSHSCRGTYRANGSRPSRSAVLVVVESGLDFANDLPSVVGRLSNSLLPNDRAELRCRAELCRTV